MEKIIGNDAILQHDPSPAPCFKWSGYPVTRPMAPIATCAFFVLYEDFQNTSFSIKT